MDDKDEKVVDKKIAVVVERIESVHNRVGRLEVHHESDTDNLKVKIQAIDDLLFRAHPGSGKEAFTTRISMLEKANQRMEKRGAVIVSIFAGILATGGGAGLIYLLTRGG